MLWVDSGSVIMLNTIHNIDNKVQKKWRRLREISTNSKKVSSVFESTSCKILPIPKFINNYNNYMGGVDVAD